MSEELLILVDGDDNKIGLEEKVRCHMPNGLLHRAFTALLFDPDGRLLLTRRSAEKMLWPGDWDGTVASHPRESETYASSAERRMPEEIGISCSMEYLFKFEYHVPYRDIGSENEICGTLIGTVDADSEFRPVEGEISETWWITPENLLAGIQDEPGRYCPWMLIALRLLPQHTRYGHVRAWGGDALQVELVRAVRSHLPDSDWRLLQ